MSGSVSEHFVRYADEIAVVQLADMPNRVELGAGELPCVEFLRTVRQSGFAGVYELEHYLTEPTVSGEERALELLRGIDQAASLPKLGDIDAAGSRLETSSRNHDCADSPFPGS
jgi:sugar phosphate isomerase/epimerase